MKRFLQGLVLGLVIAAIVMGITIRNDDSLAGESLVEKARELGMVFPKESSGPDSKSDDKKSKATSTPEPTDSGGKKGAGVGGDEDGSEEEDSEESTEKPDESATPEPTATPEASEKPAPTKTPKPKKSAKPKKTPKPKESEDPDATPTPSHKELPDGTVVHFRVRSGLLSSSVAREMYEAGIIDDLWDFDHYLENHGLGSSIISGTYDLTVGDSYANLARIITHGG